MNNLFLILHILLIINSASIYSAEKMSLTPLKVVKAFCQWEFEGSPDIDKRAELVFFSKAADEKRKKIISSWASIYYVHWEDAPRIIVTSYKIENINEGTGKIEATIMYHVVGHSKKQDVFVAEKPRDEIVKLVLRKISNQWKIVDPPDWLHVSKEATLKLAKEDLGRMEELVKNPKSTPYKKVLLEQRKNAVESIMKMSEDFSK